MITLEAIKQGIDQGEFFLEYLPIISLVDERCIGAEALIRWRKDSQVIPPSQFIPIAEDTPMSGLITYWVIEQVNSEMSDWLRANPSVCLSLNVPPEIIGRGGLLHVAEKVGLRDLFPQLVLEITERGIPDKLGLDGINSCRDLGIKVALDDVTLSGSANLALFSRAHIDIIKLDRSLINQITAKCPNPEWLQGVTALFQTGTVKVIAEGVETAQQMDVLKKANILKAQGFYFSAPISAEAFFSYFEIQNNK